MGICCYSELTICLSLCLACMCSTVYDCVLCVLLAPECWPISPPLLFLAWSLCCGSRVIRFGGGGGSGPCCVLINGSRQQTGERGGRTEGCRSLALLNLMLTDSNEETQASQPGGRTTSPQPNSTPSSRLTQLLSDHAHIEGAAPPHRDLSPVSIHLPRKIFNSDRMVDLCF